MSAWRHMMVAVHGDGVAYVTSGINAAAMLLTIRQRIAQGEYPVGIRHEAHCGIWRGQGCRCRTEIARLTRIDGMLPELRRGRRVRTGG